MRILSFASRNPAIARLRRGHTILLLLLVLTAIMVAPLIVTYVQEAPHREWMVLGLLLGAMGVAILATAWLRRRRAARNGAESEPEEVSPDASPLWVRELLNVERAATDGPYSYFLGALRVSADEAFRVASRAAAAEDRAALLQPGPRRSVVLSLAPKTWAAQAARASGPGLPLLLLALTILTTTFVGALYQGLDPVADPSLLVRGLPYSAALLAVLGTHELGHYALARWHGMKVSLPYFIPVPFALGTFGAFIRLRSPSRTRASLFDMAVAGPLAGLVIAIPVLYFGLQSSVIIPPEQWQSRFANPPDSLPSSLLLEWVAHWSLGPAYSHDSLLLLSPLAFAGYIGLLLTALNLLPVGQLDGGHISCALFGPRVHAVLGIAVSTALLVVAITIFHWMILWAILALIMSMAGSATPLNGVTPAGAGRMVLGVLTFVLLLLLLIPPMNQSAPADRPREHTARITENWT